MPCFCKETSLGTMPSATLNVRAVPPQLKNLLALLNLEPIEGPRIDAQLGEALPPGGMPWLSATLSAQAPGIAIPMFPPIGGSAVMTAMLQLSAAASMFPLNDLRALLAELQQAALSLAANLAPQMRPLMALPQPSLSNMALAARLTLDLRAKGICPMTLTQVNINAKYAASLPTYQGAMALSANFTAAKIPPFGLPLPQLQLAQSLAGMAAVGQPGPGMPNISDPNFIAQFKAQMKALAALPLPKLKIPAALPGIMADLDVINEAFGEGAFTPGGIAQINAMLNIMASWKIPVPLPAANLSAQLDVTPALPDVLQGLQAAQSSGAAFAAAASASASFGVPPILGLMEQLSTLSALLTKDLKVPPFGPCNVCAFPIKDIAASLANVPIPEMPKF